MTQQDNTIYLNLADHESGKTVHCIRCYTELEPGSDAYYERNHGNYWCNDCVEDMENDPTR